MKRFNEIGNRLTSTDKKKQMKSKNIQDFVSSAMEILNLQ